MRVRRRPRTSRSTGAPARCPPFTSTARAGRSRAARMAASSEEMSWPVRRASSGRFGVASAARSRSGASASRRCEPPRVEKRYRPRWWRAPSPRPAAHGRAGARRGGLARASTMAAVPSMPVFTARGRSPPPRSASIWSGGSGGWCARTRAPPGPWAVSARRHRPGARPHGLDRADVREQPGPAGRDPARRPPGRAASPAPAPGRLHQPREEARRAGIVLQHRLRVPLHAHREGAVRKLDGLDDAVRRGGRDQDAVPGSFTAW